MKTTKPASWFRLYAEFATDPKVQMLSEQDQRRYIMLLCFRCSNGDVTLHDEEVTFLLRVTADEWASTKARLLAKNLIGEDNKPTAWDKRQYASDSSTERVSAWRKKKKQGCNVAVTAPETETETEIKPSDTDVSLVGSEAANVVAGKINGVPSCPHQRILDLYAEILPELPQPRAWEGQRSKNLTARWRWVLTATRPRSAERYATDADGGVDFFRRMFSYVRDSDFLMGRNGGWGGCDLGWIVKAENFEKIIAGNYANKEAA